MSADEALPPGDPAPELLDDRIWIDGCFDFFHHGHAGAIVQARQLGNELYVGVHSDEAILDNKGPSVMTMAERLAAVDACRWVTRSVADAPYVTSLPWITHFGCRYVVHGDDITSDSSGEDCYRFVKAANRFRVVKRTPSISTTDLVGRMLLCTKTHFIKSLENVLEGLEGNGTDEERKALGQTMKERIKLYATDASAKNTGADVWFWEASLAARTDATVEEAGEFKPFIRGPKPKPGQRVVYVDGGFDLFSSGHIQFLRMVVEREVGKHGKVPFVVAGVHDDHVINHWKGVNYPIMNIYERGLCVLQCRHINAVVFGAPFAPTTSYLEGLKDKLGFGRLDCVYHGPTSFMPLTYDPYTTARRMGLYEEIPQHEYAGVNAGTIVQRILRSRDQYEARQKAKGMKAEIEEAQRKRELEEEVIRNSKGDYPN